VSSKQYFCSPYSIKALHIRLAEGPGDARGIKKNEKNVEKNVDFLSL